MVGPADSPHGPLSASASERLRKRARALARVEEVDREASSAADEKKDIFLSFRLMGEQYGLPLNVVREVMSIRSITQMPGSPAHVTGLTRFKGKMLTLVDLRRFWQGSAAGHADSDLAVVVGVAGVEFGLVCTQVEGLIEIVPDEIHEVPQNLSTSLAGSLTGLAHRETMLIAPDRLIAQENFLVHQGWRER